jgi:selenocysteine lyase/cysteine desulfurase
MDRRNFLQSALAIAGTASLSTPSFAAFAQNIDVDAPPQMPGGDLFTQNEEEYWRQIRRQFIIPEDEIYLNNGTVGSCPLPVLKAVFDSYRETNRLDEANPEDYPIWGYGPWNQFRDPLAEFIGVTRDELALVRNSTEANNFMANGLDMKPGDEVLISDQEHPSGREPWKLRAKRYGIVVKQYEIPQPLTNASDLLNRVNDAITPRTRILFTSHITTTTGVVQPIKQICDLARTKGLVSMIDGAQVTGAMRLNVRDIGCDMYGSSPHKWLMGPKGTGFLYVRNEMIDRMWSTVTTEGWDQPELRAERFQHFGSSNLPTLAGMKAAVDFANQIGIDRIEKRNRQLNEYMWSKMNERGAENLTAIDPQFRCAIVTVNVPPIRMKDLEPALWSRDKIRVRGGGSRIRLSTPYYLQMADIDRFLEKFDEFKRNYNPTA